VLKWTDFVVGYGQHALIGKDEISRADNPSASRTIFLA